MRIESSVTSVSWLPLGAVQALPDLAFASGLAYYDPPPPDQLHDPEELLARGAARFVNQLRAFIEVQGGGRTKIAINFAWTPITSYRLPDAVRAGQAREMRSVPTAASIRRPGRGSAAARARPGPLQAQATQVLMPFFDPALLLALNESQRGAVLAGVPTMLFASPPGPPGWPRSPSSGSQTSGGASRWPPSSGRPPMRHPPWPSSRRSAANGWRPSRCHGFG
jgi:hypothetical protein